MTTFAGLVATFVEFLTVAIHTILYERAIYPAETFLSARKYQYAVRQNRHPRVCGWIQDAVSAVEAELLKGTVARVALVIFSASSQPLERFLFDLSNFPEVPPDELNTPFERATVQESSRQPAGDETALVSNDLVPDLSVNLEEQFRATMARLSTCGSHLGQLPPDCTYTVVIENKHNAPPPIGRPQPWIPVEPNLQVERSTDEQSADHFKQNSKQSEKEFEDTQDSDLGGARTLPIRSVKAGEMIFELWVEEGKSKGLLAEASAG
ncbi:MAG: hypothetical protein M1821_000326 [Bathelium mastoideum]|nr:MAG: hypothetical protein M1821_000326 [Bathelium mastoideum]